MASRPNEETVHLRVVVHDPIPGVVLRLQSGRTDLVSPSSVSESRVTFDFTVRVSRPLADGPVVFHGPFTQGPPKERFVYINAGRRAGQVDSGWDRRAKIPLTGIAPELIGRAALLPGGRLEVGIGGRGRDGGPVCALVKLPPDAWKACPGAAV